MAHVGCPTRPLFALRASMGVCHHSCQGLMALALSPRVRVCLPLACVCTSPCVHVPLPLACALPSPLHTCTPALTCPTPPCSHFACGQGRVGCTGPGWCAWAQGGVCVHAGDVRGPWWCMHMHRAMRVGGATHKGGSRGGAPALWGMHLGWCPWVGAQGGVHEGGSGERVGQGQKGRAWGFPIPPLLCVTPALNVLESTCVSLS